MNAVAECGMPQMYESTVMVKMSDHWTTERPTRYFCVDACIWPEVAWLINVQGVRTVESCCGHGVAEGFIQVTEENRNQMYKLGYDELVGLPYCYRPKFPITHVSTRKMLFDGVPQKLAPIPKLLEHFNGDLERALQHVVEHNALCEDVIRILRDALKQLPYIRGTL